MKLTRHQAISAWTGRTVDLPCDEEEYARELNKRIAEEGKFPIRD